MAGARYLLSPWPWRSVAYLLSGVLLGVSLLVGLVLLAVLGGMLALVVVGLPLLVGLVLAGIPVARLERRRLRLVDAGTDPADPHRTPGAEGLRPWLTTRLRERATWRELGYALLLAGLLWPVDALLVTVGLLFPAALAATPLLMATVGDGREAKVLKQWTVTTWPAAFAVAVLGLALLCAGAYLLGVGAGARGALTRLLIASREGELG
ncbi:MAG: sensor domain-containing protein, partial [Streptomyces sp.]|nr:sensor domain-containing protein [Streptomyces sp.]